MTDTAREALGRAIEFITKEYRDPALEPEGEWLPTEARKVHAQLVAALAAPSPAPALDEAEKAIEQSEVEFFAELRRRKAAPVPDKLDDVAMEIVERIDNEAFEDCGKAAAIIAAALRRAAGTAQSEIIHLTSALREAESHIEALQAAAKARMG